MTSESETQPESFEEALSELESIVDTLERGDLTLEQSLAAFERGIKLTSGCRKALNDAEQRVQILSGERPDSEPRPFEDHD